MKSREDNTLSTQSNALNFMSAHESEKAKQDVEWTREKALKCLWLDFFFVRFMIDSST